MLFAAMAPLPGHAEPDQRTERTVAPPALSHPKRNASRNSTAAQLKPTEQAPEPAKPWSLDDALPTNSPAAQSRNAKPASPAKSNVSKANSAKPDLGRLPLSGGAGSFGVETETKLKSTEFPDGRHVPGVDSSRHQPPSYFGLSISVPTEK
jgi:hypothetical protein